MNSEPFKPTKCRVHTFIDGQNLFLTAKECFGYSYPNYDPVKLSQAITNLEENRVLCEIHFYTGVHKIEENEFLHKFWMNKLQGMRRAGVDTHHRFLKYSVFPQETCKGKDKVLKKPREKGIDLKIALDLIRLARQGIFDVAIIFSQDTDLNEAIKELYSIKKEFNRWLYFECAFPFSENINKYTRGLENTMWRKISKELYDRCLDTRDYRPKEENGHLF